MPIVPTRPPLLPGPFAYNGDKNTIPDTGADAGAASWSSGFPPVTQLPFTAGGIPPQRNDFNGVLNAYGVLLSFIQTGALFEWSDELTYPFPCRVLGSNGTLYEWVSASGVGVEAGAHDPTTDNDEKYWKAEQRDKGGRIPGEVVPFYNVNLGGPDNRNPIFWGQSEPDTGWLICDGGSDGRGGSVPDLRGKFVMCSTYSGDAGQTGGATSVTPTVSVQNATQGGSIGNTTATGNVGVSGTNVGVQGTTLSVAQLASHSHRNSLKYVNADTSESTSSAFSNNGNPSYYPTDETGGNQWHDHGVYDPGHTHSFSGTAHTHTFTGAVHTHVATADPINTLPPYYKMAYCVKLPG